MASIRLFYAMHGLFDLIFVFTHASGVSFETISYRDAVCESRLERNVIVIN